ncbi:MAG: beta-ketoacyl-[acyl-carrier-protein] synthase II [Gammaproteobacteria bacterium]|nr:MAG: beta-ketoacyl-[acyl-carrier-protein] synthase II [Gammaproteobacteria bacterium]
MNKRRVVVTGLGIISPVGNSIEESWKNIVDGKTGITNITKFDAGAFASQVGGEVKGFDPKEYISPKDVRKMDPFIQYGMAAGIQAFKDSGLEVTEENADRIGVMISSGIGGIGTIEKADQVVNNQGPRKISPFFVPSSIINMISGNFSIMHGLKGPNFSLVSACATATHSIGMSARMIACGDADVMVAGGAEMAITPTGLGGFSAAKALTSRNDDPEGASRPWDKDRDGFILGEGAGVLILEEYEFAKARGAKIYAELSGFAANGDAYHMTQPLTDGSGAKKCMQLAVKDAGINLSDIDYINAHGTSTPAGDIAETTAIKAAFGEDAKKLVISSTKSMTGHLLGAAGGIEAIFSVLSLRDQIVSPTLNLENPEEGCDLDYNPGASRDVAMTHVLSNSFGFGGTNACLLFSKM